MRYILILIAMIISQSAFADTRSDIKNMERAKESAGFPNCNYEVDVSTLNNDVYGVSKYTSIPDGQCEVIAEMEKTDSILLCRYAAYKLGYSCYQKAHEISVSHFFYSGVKVKRLCWGCVK